MIDIPEHFYINNREPVDHFEPNESLYFRFNQEQFSEQNSLPVAAIRFPDFSVNRGEFSEPSDVLIPHWLDWGVAEFKVQAIPSPLHPEDERDQREFHFIVKHDPISPQHRYFNEPTQGFENYAHSEIRTFVDNAHLTKEPPPFIRKQFRMRLRNVTTIIPTA